MLSDGKNLYIAQLSNPKIHKIVIASGVVNSIAGTGSPGSSNVTGTSASFQSPTDITKDGTNLYVAEMGNNTIRQIE